MKTPDMATAKGEFLSISDGLASFKISNRAQFADHFDDVSE